MGEREIEKTVNYRISFRFNHKQERLCATYVKRNNIF